MSDDYSLLRFLRARRFNLGDAMKMRTDHLQWRKQRHVDTILQTRPPRLDLLHKIVPTAHHGEDKEGRPVLYEKLGKCGTTTMAGLFNVEEFLNLHIYKMEYLCRRCQESSVKFNKHIEAFTIVLDLEGVQIDQNSNVYLTACSQNDNLNYPERVGRLIIVHAPWIFPFLWKIASPFIDARTKAKISIIYGDPSSELLKFIPKETLPKEYGGACECKGTGAKCIEEFDLKDIKISDISGVRGAELKTTIAAGKQFQVKHVVSNKGGTVHWFFRVEGDYNVNFGVEFEPDPKGTQGSQTLKKPTRVVVDQGQLSVTGAGTLVVTWDNSFSYWTAKNLQYSTVYIDNDNRPPELDPPDHAPPPPNVTGKDEDRTAPPPYSPSPSSPSTSSPSPSSPPAARNPAS